VKLRTSSPAYVVGFSAAAAAVFTAAIMSLQAATEPLVRRNEALQRQRALVEAFALAGGRQLDDGQTVELYERSIRPLDAPLIDPQTGTTFNDPRAGPRGPRTFRAVGADGAPLGYAFPVWGIGFWARIDGYLAVRPGLDRIVGIVFTGHSETPGLGGRITEPQWRGRFAGLNIAPRGGGERPMLYIGGRRPSGRGGARSGRYVDAITGATGTSRAVERFLNERIRQFGRAADAAGIDKTGK